MEILVLGASGGCGREVVRQAAARGHRLTAVVRPAADFAPPAGVSVTRGEVTDPAFLRPLVETHDLVLSCLGLRRAGRSPWAALRSPPDLVQRVMRAVTEAAAGREEFRLLWISAGGAGESRAQATWPVRRLIGAGNVGVAYRDLEAAERVLGDAGVSAVAVRPVTLTDGAATGRAGPVPRYAMRSTIRRADVACWMVDVADGTRTCEGRGVLLGTVRFGGGGGR